MEETKTRRDRRFAAAWLLAASAVVAAVLGMSTGPVAIAAPTTTPTTPSTPPPTGGGTHDGLGPSLTVPATARRGTTITVSGDNWVCGGALTLTTSWSSTTTTQVSNNSFSTSLPVTEQAALGAQSVTATCSTAVVKTSVPNINGGCCGADTLTRTKPITIEAAPVDPPDLQVPPTATPGGSITVMGTGWPCTSVQLSAYWSDSPATQTVSVSKGAFSTSVSVPSQAVAGNRKVQAACVGSPSATQSASVKVLASPGGNNGNQGGNNGNNGGTTSEVEIPPPAQPQPPTSTSAEGRDPIPLVSIPAALGVIAVIAIAVVALIARRGRPAAPETLLPQPPPSPRSPHRQPPHQPTVRVSVSPDLAPRTSIREIPRAAAPPTVHVRMHIGAPEVLVRELLR
ncbi:hypothetical protein ACFRAQ_17895 [Nocardia sp. NPDC056611]|uniref:hypothetical protein n=1 Tax=Nocardia sp. NPDC056611 TaxID=3345877 RepID=UPI00367105F8